MASSGAHLFVKMLGKAPKTGDSQQMVDDINAIEETPTAALWRSLFEYQQRDWAMGSIYLHEVIRHRVVGSHSIAIHPLSEPNYRR